MTRTNIFLIFAWTCMIDTAYCADVCFNCQHIDDPSGCKEFVTCNEGQECYHEVLETEDGTAKYSWGCASPQLCKLESSLSTRRKRLGIQRCFKCCTTNFCNYGGCTRDFCSSVTCYNNVTCENTPLGHVCNCTRGYTGELCEIEIDECGSSPCQNGGNCTDHVGYYICTCPAGYTGNNCEIDTDECASSPCQTGSTCVDQVDGFSCLCEPGFTGTLCQIDIDECASSPCQYNSTCTDLVNSYRCDCLPGITGVNCDTDINDCENVTCLNNATCIDNINGFQCSCQFGFSGQFCETSLGRVCYSCEDGVDVPDNCTNKVICGQNEECYAEHELVSDQVTTYKLGCVTRGMCQYAQNNIQASLRYPSIQPSNTYTKKLATPIQQLAPPLQQRATPIQLCYQCCDYNGCNNHACTDLSSERLWSF